MTDQETSWPPAPQDHTPPPAPEDGAEEALYHGWRLLILGACCAPPVFLPLAAWQAVTAHQRRSGAGTALGLSVAGAGLFWIAALLLTLHFRL